MKNPGSAISVRSTSRVASEESKTAFGLAPVGLELEAEVRKQILVGRRNRHVAGLLEEMRTRREFELATPLGEFFCTCGRADCDEILVLTPEEYAYVTEQTHRFVVAPGHARVFDDVVRREDGHDVVEIIAEYRLLVGFPGEPGSVLGRA
jgi:hypothetical protein